MSKSSELTFDVAIPVQGSAELTGRTRAMWIARPVTRLASASRGMAVGAFSTMFNFAGRPIEEALEDCDWEELSICIA